MKVKKAGLVIMILLILGILLVGVVSAQATEKIKETFSNLGGKLKNLFGPYNAVILNSIVMIAVALILGSFVAPTEKAQKTAVYLGLSAVAIILAYQLNVSPEFAGKYLWQVAVIRDFFHLKVLVNVLIIGALGYLIMFEWLFKEKLNGKAGKWLVGITIVVLALMIVKPRIEPGETFDTMKPPYVYVWQQENLAEYRFFFLGDSGCEMVTYESEEAETVEAFAEEKEGADDARKTAIDDAVKKIDEGARKEKYCYTEGSVLEYIGAIKSGEKYKPTPKVLHEGDDIRGFGILRGKHLLILAISYGLFWWTFQLFFREETMKKVNYIMAFILALSMARGNWDIASFWGFVQYWSWFLLGIMFYKSWKGGAG